MSISFQFNNGATNVARDRISGLLYGENVYQFSCFEKFIDFFRGVFTGKSNIEDYYKIHQLLYHPKKTDISHPMPKDKSTYNVSEAPDVHSGDITNWRPVVGFVKLIDASTPEAIDRYTVDFMRQTGDMVTINMSIDGINLAGFECTTKDFEFLKENLFYESNNKIQYKEDFCSTFQTQLWGYFSKNMRGEERQDCEISNDNTEGSEPLPKNNESESCPQPDIDRFIGFMSDNLSKSDLTEKRFIGQGSYGRVYLFEEEQGQYVVKIPINNLGNKIDCNSDEHQNAHPERVSRYLNLANIDPNFSRHMKIKYDGELMDVLVSKYISGKVLDISIEDNYEMAEELLDDRGLLMHDVNVEGNIIKKEGRLYFIDGDQIVLSQDQRRKRRVSLATQKLEEQIKTGYERSLHQAKNKKNDEDIKYFSALIDDCNKLTNTAVEVPEMKKNTFIMAKSDSSLLLQETIKEREQNIVWYNKESEKKK